MEFPRRIPFVEHLGFELLRYAGGEAEIAIDLRPELLNAWGVAHGGLTLTLLDTVMGHAARSPVSSGGGEQRGVVTIEMKASFMRPGLGRLHAHGRVLQRTPSLAFCEARVLAADGDLLAHATGTFKYLRALPVGGARVRQPDASD